MLKASDTGVRKNPTGTPAPTPTAAPLRNAAPISVRKPSWVTPPSSPVVKAPLTAPTPPVVRKPAPALTAKSAAVPPRRHSRTAMIIGILVATLAVVVGTTMYMGTPERPRTGPDAGSENSIPTAGTNSVRVAAPGLIEAESGLLKLGFEMPGKVRTIRVAEGDAVRAGQILAELENADLSARVDSARADLRLAESQLKTLDVEIDADIKHALKEVDRCKADVALLKAGPRPEEIARARADVSAADAEARRTAEDAAKFGDPAAIKSGAWSVQQADTTKRLAEAAAAKLSGIKEVLRALENGSRREDIDKAEAVLASAEVTLIRGQTTRAPRIESAKAQVASAQAHLADAEATFDKTILRAPINGVIVWKYHFVGETVGALTLEPVLSLADISRLRVRADIDEVDFRNLKPGQAVTITSDAFPGKTIRGHLSSIGASAGQKKFSTGEAKEHMDVNVVEALVQIDEPTALKLGSRVTAFFEPTTRDALPCK
jgi:HlyD family secretion protein